MNIDTQLVYLSNTEHTRIKKKLWEYGKRLPSEFILQIERDLDVIHEETQQETHELIHEIFCSMTLLSLEGTPSYDQEQELRQQIERFLSVPQRYKERAQNLLKERCIQQICFHMQSRVEETETSN